ncbi:MAG: hypothetical protein M3261_03405, partial [Thermoproteota archaeon]|nr:hypothetical protein [Thermoproteota archaeon]
VNPLEGYRIETIFKLNQLAEYHNLRSFRDLQGQDIIYFLDLLLMQGAIVKAYATVYDISTIEFYSI